MRVEGAHHADPAQRPDLSGRGWSLQAGLDGPVLRVLLAGPTGRWVQVKVTEADYLAMRQGQLTIADLTAKLDLPNPAAASVARAAEAGQTQVEISETARALAQSFEAARSRAASEAVRRAAGESPVPVSRPPISTLPIPRASSWSNYVELISISSCSRKRLRWPLKLRRSTRAASTPPRNVSRRVIWRRWTSPVWVSINRAPTATRVQCRQNWCRPGRRWLT